MADTFTTSLSIRQIETGTRSGTWGTETNTQYELLDNAFSYVANDLASDADATLTISDGTASNARYFYIKFTSAVSLTATRTITLAPDDSSKIWIVENATTGSQALTFKQGSSGSTVTVSNGNTAMIYADGAGATNGAIENVLSNIQISDSIDLVGSTPTLTIGDGGEEDTKLVFDGNAQDFYIGLDDSADDLIIGSGSAVGTTPAITIDENQDVTITQDLTATNIAGTLTTAAQPNITSVGTLTGFTSTGIDDNADATAITIDSSENVGIGTTSPNQDGFGTESRVLTVKAPTSGGTGALELIGLANTSGDLMSAINFMSYAQTSPAARITAPRHTSDTEASIAFDTSGTERMRITNAGSVGINETSPDSPLHVTGEIRAQDSRGGGTAAVILNGGGASAFPHIGVTLSNPLTFQTADTERMRIDGSGKISMGTTSAIGNAVLTIENSANTKMIMRMSAATAGKYWRQEVDSGNLFWIINQNSTGVYITDGGTSWTGLSDENLKENIVELTGVLDKVRDFRCVEYNLIADEADSKKIGFIAQDWQEDYSQVVSQDENGNLGMQYTETIPILLKAIQEQQTIIDDLKSRIETLENA